MDQLAPYTVDVGKVPGPDWTHSVAVETIERLRRTKASEKAVDVMRFMAIVGCDDGGVQMEWHAHGYDVEINVGADGVVECFWMNKRVVADSAVAPPNAPAEPDRLRAEETP